MSPTTKQRNRYMRWTLDDLRFLEQHYKTLPMATIAIQLGRSQGAVALMAHKLHCRRSKSPAWTAAEDALLRTHYAWGVEAEHLTMLLPGRSSNAIFSRAENLGIISGRFWRDEELQILTQYYPLEGTAVAQRLPGRSSMSIKIKAGRLGIKRIKYVT